MTRKARPGLFTSPSWRPAHEVLADWRYEASRAPTGFHRARIGARSLVAFTRTIACIAVRQMTTFSLSIVPVFAGVAALTVLAIAVAYTLFPPEFVSALPPGAWEQVRLGGIASVTVQLLPAIFFASALTVRQSVASLLGAFLVASGSVMLAEGWLMPLLGPMAPAFTADGAGSRFLQLVPVGGPTLSTALLDPAYNALSALIQLDAALGRAAFGGCLMLAASALGDRRLSIRLIAAVAGAACAFFATPFRLGIEQPLDLAEQLFWHWAAAFVVLLTVTVACVLVAIPRQRSSSPPV